MTGASALRRLAPGLALAALVGVAATLLAPGLKAATGGTLALPAMVLALAIGVAAHAIAARPVFQPGLTFSVKTLLRWAIGLLGLRIALGDIVDLGAATALLVVVSMAATLVGAVMISRAVGLGDGNGALAGAANAVCGASATLATATAVPDYARKSADVAFAVVMANAISTVAMLAYPSLSGLLGLDATGQGVFLGATIHDMAQVVGAGYAVSEPVGNAAVIVKLFRVFLLLPVVLVVGLHFARAGGPDGAHAPMPVFALAFLGLCGVNTLMASAPALSAAIGYPAAKAVLSGLADAGLLIAIAALGLGTSARAVLGVGWRHAVVFLGATVIILIVVAAGLSAIG